MKEKQGQGRKVKMDRILFILAVGMVFASITSAIADQEDVAQGIVDKAQATLSEFIRDPKSSSLRSNLDHAWGVFIFPEVR